MGKATFQFEIKASLILVLLLLKLGTGNAQEYEPDTAEIKDLNSSIKGMVYAFPGIFGPYIYGVSAGVEIRISQKHFVTAGGYFYKSGTSEGDSGPSNFYNVYIGHRRYLLKKQIHVFCLETNVFYKYENKWY